MKKIISLILTFVILSSCIGINTNAVTPKIENIDDIPLDWTGYYEGLGAKYGEKRGMDMHISNIEPDGKIIGVISLYQHPDEEYGVDGSYVFDGSIEFETGRIILKGTKMIDFPVGSGSFGFGTFDGYINIASRLISGVVKSGGYSGGWHLNEMTYEDFDVDWGFTLGRDNNSFIHNNFNDNEGFYQVENYQLKRKYYKELIYSENKKEKKENGRIIRENQKQTWYGSCVGVSSTMGLLFNGLVNISDLSKEAASSYFELPKPCEDREVFLNVIQYYQLSQHLPKYCNKSAQIVGTGNTEEYSSVSTYGTIGESRNIFLKELVNQVKNYGIKRLSYGYMINYINDDGVINSEYVGHSILAVGCSYNTITSNYTVTMYDLNTVGTTNENGVFTKMVISKDFNTFRLYNESGRVIINQDSYLYMSLFDIELINDISKLAPKSGSSEPTAEEEIDPSHALINISLDNDFTVTSGNYFLQCSEGKLSSTMGVYDILPYIDGDRARFYIEVDNYPDFTIIPQAETLDIAIMQDDYYMSLKSENLDSAYCNTSDRTLTMRGNDYNYKAFMGVDCMVGENEGGLISLEGNSPCDITVDDEGGCAVITSDGVPFNDITLKSYITTDVYEKTDIPTTESYLFSGEYQGHTLLYGDTNFDGKVTAADSLKVLRKSINIDKFDILKDKLADVNSDGKVNAKDALLIQRYTIGLKNTGAAGRSAE